MASTSSSSNDFDILRLIESGEEAGTSQNAHKSTKEPTTREKSKDGPICQTLSYFDVIYPHLQIAYARSHLQSSATNPGAPKPFEIGNFCKVLFKHMNKGKRTRTSFTVDQLEGLEQYFRESQYVTSADRKMIAERLALSETQFKRVQYNDDDGEDE